MKASLYCSEPPGCICEKCLYHWSGMCPYGSCYDDLRAKINPYDKAHPGEPPRTSWSSWREDQAAWCRGGIFYQSHDCDKFVEYTGSTVKECLEANVQIYQDGYIHCSLVESVGCEECMRRFDEKQAKKEQEDMRNCGLPEDRCCLNRNGTCTLDTADCRDIDKAAEMKACGFIGVNDRYLLWKYGVPYKELVCGNCGYFDAGEYSHGDCTCELVEPHSTGVRENGQVTYKMSKERYDGALACKNFIKRGSEKMPKKTYWTKCGRQFQKNSTAMVTGHEIDLREDGTISEVYQVLKEEASEALAECSKCPFKEKVTEGYPGVFKRWECRAGSQPPNHTTEWTGSLTDKNSIQIHSLDVALMEEIMSYCEAHPALGAAYNTDHLEDCRRTIAVHCISNKTGIAAKNELIEKFFHAKDEEMILENNNGLFYCEQDDCPFNDRECGCQYEKDEDSDGFWSDIQSAVNDFNCKNKTVLQDFKTITDPDSCDVQPEEESSCLTDKGKRSCGSCSYGHWFSGDNTYTNVVSDDGRSTIKRPCEPNTHYCYQFTEGQKKIAVDKDFNPDTAPEWCPLKQPEPVNQEVNEKMEIEQKTDENDVFLPENITKTDEIAVFDYSSVDKETGAFLMEKAKKIFSIKTKAMLEIAVELEEVHNKLSNHYQGTFGAWCESIGITDRTARNYLSGLDWVRKNFPNIEDAKDIQQSLLFAVSKPSAPMELQNGVKSGDITTHKQYKELEEKLHKKEQELESTKEFADKQAKYADEHMMRARTAEFELEKKKKAIESLQSDLQYTKRQLEEAVNSPKDNVVELMELAREKQCEIEALRKQLKDKPMEVQAVREVEKIVQIPALPDPIATGSRIHGLLTAMLTISKTEIEACRGSQLPIVEKLQSLQKLIPELLASLEPARSCEECNHCTLEGLDQEDKDAGYIYCKREFPEYPQLLHNKPCNHFTRR